MVPIFDIVLCVAFITLFLICTDEKTNTINKKSRDVARMKIELNPKRIVRNDFDVVNFICFFFKFI